MLIRLVLLLLQLLLLITFIVSIKAIDIINCIKHLTMNQNDCVNWIHALQGISVP